MNENVDITPNFTIKSYNDEYFKLVWNLYPGKRERIQPSRDINDNKLEVNLSRARSKIFEYAMCNEWEFMVTFTLNKEKIDRYNLGVNGKAVTKYWQNRRRSGEDARYLLLPEQHKDKAWHFHGLMNGLNQEELILFTLEDNIPKKLKDMIRSGRKLYHHRGYDNKFGFNVIERVMNKEAVSKYITKYISKALVADLDREKEKKLYYVSRGLKTSEKLIEGALPTAMLEEATLKGKKFDYVKLLDMDSQGLYNFMQSYSRYINYNMKT